MDTTAPLFAGLDPGTVTPLFAGLDPGLSGALVLVTRTGQPYASLPLNAPLPERFEFLAPLAPEIRGGLIERVGYRPGDGGQGAFTFGQSFGEALALLSALHVPHDLVTPTAWRTRMGARIGDSKKALKALAERLLLPPEPGPRQHPTHPFGKLTLRNCDAFLLARLSLLRYTSQCS